MSSKDDMDFAIQITRIMIRLCPKMTHILSEDDSYYVQSI